MVEAPALVLQNGSLIDTAEKKFRSATDLQPSSLHRLIKSTPEAFTMVKRKLGALEKVEADL
jgi:hypothetical protein